MSTARLPPDYDGNPIPEPPQPPRRRWKTLVRIVAALFIIAAGLLFGFILLLHNYSFRQHLLRIALPAVSRAVGADVRIRDFSLHLLLTTPSLNIDGLTVDSASPSEPPLLQADHLDIGLQIVSIMKRHWFFNNVTIDRPVLRLLVDQDGHTNLPMRETSSNRPDIFDIGIRHALVRNGEFYYNDIKNALDAALYDVEIESRFDPQSKKYSGRLSYENGRIRFRDLNPIVHSLKSDFEATPEAFTITHCTLTTGTSEVSLVATLNDYVHPKVNANYQATLNSADLEQILHGPPLPSGVVRLAGAAQFQADPNKTVLETLSSNGNMNSTSLRIHSAGIDTELREISAEYLLHGGDIEVNNLRAELLGGTLTGSYAMHDLAAAQQSKLHAVLRNADLSAIQSMMSVPAVSAFTNGFNQAQYRFRMSGAADLTLDANWQKLADAFTARASADLKGSFAPVESNGASSVIPFDGRMQVAYSAPAAELTFTRSYLRMPQTILKLSGSVSKQQSLQVQVQSDELHEVEALATAFGLVREPVELYGAASFTGRVQGSTDQPLISGQLFSPALKIRGTTWRMLHATLEASPSHLALRNAELRAADNAGRLAFDVNVPLDRWSYTGLGPFQVDLTASQLNVSELMNLVNSKTPITGALSANVSLRGSRDNLLGQGTVTLNQANIAGETVQSLTLNFRGDGDVVNGHLNTLMATGKLQGDVTYFPKQRTYDGQVQATNINLDQLRMFRTKEIHVAGALDLVAKGAGSLDNPGLDFTAHISQPQIQNYKLGDVSVEANIANHVADFVFDSQAPYRSHGRGRVELTGDYLAEATVDTAPISLAPLLAMYVAAPAADLKSQIELHAVIKGPFKNPSAIDGHITIPTFSLSYRGEVELANTQPVDVKYSNGVFTLQRTRIYGTGTNLQLEGSFPVVGTRPMSLIAAGNINLHLVQMIDPNFTSSGEVEFNINGHGRRTDPNFKGQIRIVDASFAGSGIPAALEKGNGVLNLVDGRLNIDRFQGRISNGALTASGSITYRPSIEFNLVMAADGIRLAYPPTVRTGIDANLTLTGPLQSPALKGQVRVNELWFTPAFDVEDALHKLELTKQLRQHTTRNLSLDLTVQSTNELNPASRELTLSGAANLRVRGTIAEPALLGSISLNGGELLFRGDRYILKPSTVEFVNPAAIEPRLNVAVETRVSQYNIKILLRGPIDEMRATFSSEPPLPPADTINLLVFGNTNQPVTTDSTGNLGAVSLLASGVTNTISNRLEKVAGISQLSIDPVLDNDAQGSTVGVNVQQRVTADLFVTFISDPTSEKRQVIEVEYQATPRVSVTGVVNRNGGFAADIRIRKAW